MNFRSIAANNWPILAIVAIASILRFWHLESLTTFSGDQGYDFLIVKRMLVDGKWTLLGPKLGPQNPIGNVYLGPAYYYLIAPFLLIFNFDPIGPSVLMVILSIATIVTIYLICINFFSKKIAVLASSLYAINVPLIEQSRVALNPFPIPFFASVALLSSSKILTLKRQTLIWPIILGFALGILFQLHYLAVALIFTIFLILLFTKKLRSLLYSVCALIVAILPQLLFELRHQFFITNQIARRIFYGQDLSSPGVIKLQIAESLKILSKSFLLTDHFIFLSSITLTILLIVYAKKNGQSGKILILLAISVLAAVLSASLYSASMQLHYFASIYPSLVILMAIAINEAFNYLKNFLLKIIFLVLVVQIFAASILNLDFNRTNGYTMPEGWNMIGVKKASSTIAADIDSSAKYNVAATLDGDTRARPYRYLLEVKNKMPLDVVHYPQADVIYLISRDGEDAVKNYKVWEVASFAPFAINKLSDIQNGIKVYKLEKLQ